MSVKIEELRAEFTGNTKGFDKASANVFQKITAVATSFNALVNAGKIVAGIFGTMKDAAVGLAKSVWNLADSTAGLLDNLGKMSKRTGLSVEFLSKLDYIAQRSGTTLQVMEKSVRFMSRAALEASKGVAEYADTFEELGVEVVDANGKMKDGEALFMELLFALGDTEGALKRVALAQDIFSRGGTAMLPIMADGREGLEKLLKRYDDLGIRILPASTDAGERFKDSLLDMNVSIARVWREIGERLIPIFRPVIDGITKWFIANKALIDQRIDRFFVTVRAALKELEPVIAPIREFFDAILAGDWDSAKAAISELWATFKKGIADVWASPEVQKFWEHMREAAREIGGLLAEGVWRGLKAIPEKIHKGWIGAPGRAVADVITKFAAPGEMLAGGEEGRARGIYAMTGRMPAAAGAGGGQVNINVNQPVDTHTVRTVIAPELRRAQDRGLAPATGGAL